MGDFVADPTSVPPDIVERKTLCLSRPQPGMVVHGGDDGFKDDLLRLYSPAESNAAEELVKLKDALRNVDSEHFWPMLTEGLASIADAQYAFVSKRILVDEHDVAVEMPPIGEPGSCLMGAAFYLNDGHGIKQQISNFKYHAYSCPCAYMRHDKIFIIPDNLNDFIVNNPNPVVVPGEAYLGIPLFADGKCFAHFGVMWSAEGAKRRTLGWGYLEMLFHSLEDMILQRVLEADSKFSKSDSNQQRDPPRIIPHEAISIAQSLKPYARSLSHELRTPMQGVVGMLDVIMANAKEAAESPESVDVSKFLKELKESIEVVQDSSRRAVEAADNIVHAYDMNMGVPETPLSPLDKGITDNVFLRQTQPDILVTGNNISIKQFQGTKRKREELAWRKTAGISGDRARVARAARQRPRHSHSEEPFPRHLISASMSKTKTDLSALDSACSHEASEAHCDSDLSTSPVFASEHSTVPGLRHTSLREVVQYVFNDALKVGGRPESAVSDPIDFGEIIEVRSRTSSGQAHTKSIEWTVAPDVPDTILIDEKDLAKMISCVVLNAIKFTDNGTITLRATLSTNARYIVINVKDSGAGIPAAFLPNLFKPFAREDNSTTRESEGLGLGLLVAKGLARKLGGDLFCLQSHVSGPQKGSEFQMRIPLMHGDVCSRPSSPFGSPSPSLKSRQSVDADMPPLPATQHPCTPPLSFDPPHAYHKTFSQDAVGPSPTFNHNSSFRHLNLPPVGGIESPSRPRGRSKSRALPESGHVNHDLAKEYPLNFLVAEDNKINRKLLLNMLQKLGYSNVAEAFDGNDAVEKMRQERNPSDQIDVVLMDLWMPFMDGFQATEKILAMGLQKTPTILAVSADITDEALGRTARVGMKGFLTKPFQIRDLEKLIRQYCASRHDGTL
ncbi:hypothetical protein B0J11DRAFT_427355 [Dendryphion nanum]|uniref:histidine kinase n=1 Tax=Dendryphion nanum TaxID=256645 RepID=A0A9P9IVB4_9PLEO|nr:hypothetical protein B0J11DRAFT_427355 [Dendryphion nanum]